MPIWKSFIQLYKPVLAQHGIELSLLVQYSAAELNGSCERLCVQAKAAPDNKTQYLIIMDEFAVTGFSSESFSIAPVSNDGLMQSLCHELGHITGGYPTVPVQQTGNKIASAEGQADYFASMVCLKKLWGDQLVDNEAASRKAAPAVAALCSEHTANPADRNLCARIIVSVRRIAFLTFA